MYCNSLWRTWTWASLYWHAFPSSICISQIISGFHSFEEQLFLQVNFAIFSGLALKKDRGQTFDLTITCELKESCGRMGWAPAETKCWPCCWEVAYFQWEWNTMVNFVWNGNRKQKIQWLFYTFICILVKRKSELSQQELNSQYDFPITSTSATELHETSGI